jgi:PAS domain S-box-containing protein
MLQEITPTIIISDIVMPKMNGYELCNTVKMNSDTKDTPVILLTSLADPEDVINGLICGADNFIIKPYEEKFLLSRIKYILANMEVRKTATSRIGIEIIFRDKRYFLNSERVQMIDLLLSTYEAALQRNLDYQLMNEKLQDARAELERRVQERTAELLIANVQLQKENEERKLAEKSLRESEAQYKRLVEGSPDIVWAFSDKRGTLYASSRVEAILGYSPEYLCENPWMWNKSIHPDDQGFIAQAISDFAAGKDLDIVYQIKNASGNWRWFNDRSIGRITINGETIIEGISTDITERRLLEEQLRQSQKMEAIGTLAGGVAHDFNNILTTIIGNAELVLDELDEKSTLYGMIEQTIKAGERAAVLTRQLLTFSRKQIVQPRIIDLNDILKDMEKMISRLIGEDIDLLFLQMPGLWRVAADPGQIEQIIMNLSINARDAMPTGGRLTIETSNIELDSSYFCNHGVNEEQTGPYVMLAVSDTGIGMVKEIQDHIFEPFFTTKEIGKGTGLGLSTVYGIVKQNKGFIWVYSEPGQGSVFKIYLPRVEGDVESEKKEKSPATGPAGSETILLVEDDESLQKLVQIVLEQNGYKILKAINGEDALRVAEAYEGPIDMIITDVVMPRIGGRELIKRLQPLYPDVKVIYMSGHTDRTIAHHGLLETGLNFIQKPFSIRELAQKVREILNS